MPVQKGYVRGENGPGCWVMTPIPNEPNKCVFQWLLDTNLKVSIHMIWKPVGLKILNAFFFRIIGLDTSKHYRYSAFVCHVWLHPLRQKLRWNSATRGKVLTKLYWPCGRSASAMIQQLYAVFFLLFSYIFFSCFPPSFAICSLCVSSAVQKVVLFLYKIVFIRVSIIGYGGQYFGVN